MEDRDFSPFALMSIMTGCVAMLAKSKTDTRDAIPTNVAIIIAINSQQETDPARLSNLSRSSVLLFVLESLLGQLHQCRTFYSIKKKRKRKREREREQVAHIRIKETTGARRRKGRAGWKGQSVGTRSNSRENATLRDNFREIKTAD